jgi:hypothetical protein
MSFNLPALIRVKVHEICNFISPLLVVVITRVDLVRPLRSWNILSLMCVSPLLLLHILLQLLRVASARKRRISNLVNNNLVLGPEITRLDHFLQYLALVLAMNKLLNNLTANHRNQGDCLRNTLLHIFLNTADLDLIFSDDVTDFSILTNLSEFVFILLELNKFVNALIKRHDLLVIVLWLLLELGNHLLSIIYVLLLSQIGNTVTF